jgi:DNA polymerase III subunit delta
VIAGKAQLDKALAAPASVRCFLFHGADEAGSRALANRLAESLGPGAERLVLPSAELKSDPARLADEAASLSMFGDARLIIVDPATDDAAEAVDALLAGGAAGNPVALIAGELKKTSKLLKLVEPSPRALSFESKAPTAADAQSLVAALAREHGLTVAPDVARRIAEAAGANRAILAHEVEKFALYLGGPGVVDHDVVDAVGAALEEGDTSALMTHVFGGAERAAARELARLRGDGVQGITLIRAGLRHAFSMARSSRSGEAWSPSALARAVERLSAAEQAVKAREGVGPLAAEVELMEIARRAGRRRG